jgi:HAD superfamily hydrolase (TIGR01459 family)
MSVTATDRDAPPLRLYGGIGEVAEDFDGYILDLWGVLHDGLRAYPPTLECLERLRALGKRIAILSNGPRRATAVAERCRELGILPQHYDHLMSSGEETWRHLKARSDPWYRALGRRCFHLGPARDLGMREGLDETFVEALADADFILVTGILRSEDRIEDYEPFLGEALSRGLPMVCANPDLVVVRGETIELCAGTVADRYAEMGGDLRYHGKPHAPIYRTCLELFDGIAPERILAVGDSLRTDVAGARGVGVAALFVASGIHARELMGTDGTVDLERLAVLCGAQDTWPLGVLDAFRW